MVHKEQASVRKVMHLHDANLATCEETSESVHLLSSIEGFLMGPTKGFHAEASPQRKIEVSASSKMATHE